MSYILDALRRADAERERERGAVPGLHAQAVGLSLDDEPARRGLPRPVLGGAAALVLALALLAWWWPGSPPEPVAETPMVAPPTVLAPAPPVAAEPPAPVAAVPTAPRVAATVPKATAAPPKAAARPVAAEPAAVEPATPNRVASVAELPEDVRRALPGLSFGGSIYSATPANRLLIVNGQLLHEGDSLGPGATLEQIKPRAAVMRVQGLRYEVGF